MASKLSTKHLYTFTAYIVCVYIYIYIYIHISVNRSCLELDHDNDNFIQLFCVFRNIFDCRNWLKHEMDVTVLPLCSHLNILQLFYFVKAL